MTARVISGFLLGAGVVIGWGCGSQRPTPPPDSTAQRSSSARPYPSPFPSEDDLQGKLEWSLTGAKDELRWIEFLGVLRVATSRNPEWARLDSGLEALRAEISKEVASLARATSQSPSGDDGQTVLAHWLAASSRISEDRANLVRNVSERIFGNEQEIGHGMFHTPIGNGSPSVPTFWDTKSQFSWALNDTADEMRWFELIHVLMAAAGADRPKWKDLPGRDQLSRASATAIAEYAEQSRIEKAGSTAEKKQAIIHWMEWRDFVRSVRLEITRNLAERVYGVHDERTLKILGGDDE